jgi:S-adenosylmethionine hydrolase
VSVPPCIALLTDFATRDGYAGAMKGVLASLCPDARIVDITHDVPPGDVRGGAFALLTAAPTFPTGTVHLAVVDPGVGTERRGLLIEAGGSFFVGPDNGLLSLAAGAPRRVWSLDREQWFRRPVSPTFHGRDVFAPIAARVASGIAPPELGSAATGIVEIRVPPLRLTSDCLEGEVFHVDHFGNVITSVRACDLPAERDCLEVQAGDRTAFFYETYGRAPAGTVVAVVGSSGFVELSSAGASAACMLEGAAKIGAPVHVRARR